MTEDVSVMCLGEDVGYGGAYGATQGLRDKFGRARVRDTPISESAIIGFSVGASMSGLRPVAEIMHMDFIAIAMEGRSGRAPYCSTMDLYMARSDWNQLSHVSEHLVHR